MILDPGDIIIDLGNSYYKDSQRRSKFLAQKKIHFLGIGVSGGHHGARNGASFMASGNIPQNSNSYSALKQKELEMKSFRNQSIIGLLLLVFLGFIVF